MGRFGTLFFLLCLIFSFFSCTVEETEFKRRLTVVACGDVLFYDGNYRHFAENGSVEDFYRVTEPVADSVRSADVAIINQEAMTAGREFGVSGYPFFNAPFELTAALRKTGFDVFATANNHSLDRGRAGIDAAVGYYRKTGALHVGTAAGNDDPLNPLVLLVNDITIALLPILPIYAIRILLPWPTPETVRLFGSVFQKRRPNAILFWSCFITATNIRWHPVRMTAIWFVF